MTWTYTQAENGNVALVGEIDISASKGEFVLALGFGLNTAEAGQRTLASLLDGFDTARSDYVRVWQNWQHTLPSVADALSSGKPDVYHVSAAVLTAYLLLWLSTVWGLAVSSKIFDPKLQRVFTYDFHQFISLLAIGFIALHMVVLAADQYLPFSAAQILVPFIAPYRPPWVGIGVVGMYLTLLVTVTFYVRRWIGTKAFRVIHLASFVAFIAAAVHGLFAGTDSPLWTTQAMYYGTTLVVVFLTAYWVFSALAARRRSPVRSQ